MSEELKKEETQPAEKKAKKLPFNEEKMEIIVAIMLGVTALLTAWASWIGSLHGGNQATNYAESNNYSAMGNSEWNQASQNLMQDMMTWNTISQYSIECTFAEEQGDMIAVEKYEWMLDQIISENCTDEFLDAIDWAFENDSTPFEMEGYIDSYYANALEILDYADELLAEGQWDNKSGDSFNLVTVIYSLVLFLLGIVGIFKRLPNRYIIVCVAAVAFLIATIYMFTLPLPTGFSIASFFGGAAA